MALVQSSAVVNGSGGASINLSLSGLVVGDLLTVEVGWAQQTNSNPPTAAGWSVAQNPAGQSFLGGIVWVGSCIFYKRASAASESVTIVPGTGSTTCALSGIMSEFVSGLATDALDVTTNASGASGTSGNSGTTGVTANAGELIIAAVGVADAAGTPHANNGISDPATTGYSSIGANQDNTTTGTAFEASYKYVTATGTQIGNWTWSNSSAYLGTIATFKLAPRIDTQPASAIKNTGDTATFNIGATTSSGTLHYQWKVNGSNVGADSNSYTTGTLGNSNQWDAITCVVTDDNGSTTSGTAVLTIAFAAAGTGPQRRNIIAGHPVGSLGWLGIVSSSGTVTGAGYSAGLATDIAVGQSTVAANALSSAIATALAVAAATTRADAFTQGTSTASGVGATLQSGDAFTQGTSSAIAVGTSSANTTADAYSAGVATDIATGQSTVAGVAFTQGAATDIAAGQSTAAADAFTQGTSTAQAEGTTAGGGVTITADGYSAGASTAKAVGSGGLTGNTVITLGANPWMKNARAQQSAIDDENEEILQLLAQLVPQLSRGGSHHVSR